MLEVEKPKVAAEKLVAAAMGDRSENADYHAAKEKLRHIDKRLFYLNSVIQKSQIIDPSNIQKIPFESALINIYKSPNIVEVYNTDLIGCLEIYKRPKYD